MAICLVGAQNIPIRIILVASFRHFDQKKSDAENPLEGGFPSGGMTIFEFKLQLAQFFYFLKFSNFVPVFSLLGLYLVVCIFL